MAVGAAMKHPATVAATGTVVAGQARVRKVVLTPAGAVATLILRDGGAAGTVMANLQAAANGNSVVLDLNECGVQFSTDVHATIAGLGAQADVYYTEN